jgi:hypothetical protein
MTMYDDSRVVTLLREVDLPTAPPDRLGLVTRRARRHESRRATAMAGVMAVVLVAGVVSALQLGHRGNTETLTVAGAAHATAAAHTARVTMALSFTGSAAAGLADSSYILSGPVDFEHQRFALKGKLGGQAVELRGIGKDRWTTQLGIAGKKWSHTTDDTKGGGFEQVDPARLLDVLTSKGKQVSRQVVGDRTVFVLRVPADVLTPGASTEGGPQEVTVSVDGDGLVRSLETTVESGQSGEVKIRMSYDDFGIAVDVRPPPAEQVQEAGDVGSSGTSEQFSVGISGSGSSTSSPEDRKKVCEQIKAFKAQQPAPQTAEEKARQKQFDDAMTQVCAR